MYEYIERLMRCGISPQEALGVYKSMIRDFGFSALEELIADMERERNVARV